MIRFGGPVYDQNGKAGNQTGLGAFGDDPYALARAHSQKGYRAALAPKFSIHQTDMLAMTREAFAAEGVMIGEVGYWNNLLDTDPDTRTKHREDMVEALAIAEELGARCAINIPGSYCHGHGCTAHSAKNFSDDAFAECVDIARMCIDTVKPKTAFFAYEIFPFCVVDSPEMIDKLIRAVDRKQFGVHLDLANLINSPRSYWRSGEIAAECVRLFGDRITSAHVKDIKLREPAISVILEEVMPGEGGLDMRAFVRHMHALPQEVPFMMEHLNSDAEYDRAAAYIRECAAQEGITF